MPRIRRTTVAVILTLLNELVALGDSQYDYDTKITINANRGCRLIDGGYDEVAQFESLEEAEVKLREEIARLSKEKAIEVGLNENYTAEVTSEGIQVGCQTIDFDAFDELVRAVAEVRKR